MTVLGLFKKQPADVVDFDVDFSEWLTAEDSIASATATVEPIGLTVRPATVFTPIVKVWVSDGDDSAIYKITVTATTYSGRVKQVEFKVKIKDT